MGVFQRHPALGGLADVGDDVFRFDRVAADQIRHWRVRAGLVVQKQPAAYAFKEGDAKAVGVLIGQPAAPVKALKENRMSVGCCSSCPAAGTWCDLMDAPPAMLGHWLAFAQMALSYALLPSEKNQAMTTITVAAQRAGSGDCRRQSVHIWRHLADFHFTTPAITRFSAGRQLYRHFRQRRARPGVSVGAEQAEKP